MSRYLVIFQTLILCVVIVLFLSYRSSRSDDRLTAPISIIASTTPMRIATSGSDHPYINPVVVADEGKHFIINFKLLKDKIIELSKKQKQKTFVYFMYLNNASWIGLNEKDYFTAASTIKVPLAMATYRLAEQEKLKMSNEYALNELDLDAQFGDLYEAGPDGSFSVNTLIEIMLVHSDNTAMRALFNIMNLINVKTPLDDVYSVMGWERKNNGDNLAYIEINLKTLANMFLSLYNSTYLKIEHSSEILGYLSHSDFKDQLPAGVPDEVAVAHKIGVNEPDQTYSDCGIVYVPGRPYILCVGSVGAPKSAADKFISSVSRTVYEYVINN